MEAKSPCDMFMCVGTVGVEWKAGVCPNPECISNTMSKGSKGNTAIGRESLMAQRLTEAFRYKEIKEEELERYLIEKGGK